MTRKDRLIKPLIITENIAGEKLKKGWQIIRLQRQIIYVDYALIILRPGYNEKIENEVRENIANEVRAYGYTLPGFEDENYQKALDAIAALDEDRVNELENLLNEYKKLK
jgi:hypothetical protein